MALGFVSVLWALLAVVVTLAVLEYLDIWKKKVQHLHNYHTNSNHYRRHVKFTIADRDFFRDH